MTKDFSLAIKNALFIGMAFMLFLPMLAQAQVTIPDNDIGFADPQNGDGIQGVIIDVTQFLAGLLAVLAILVIVVAGILYMTSGGDESRIASAKTWLTYAIIGLIIALLAWVIVSTVAGALGAG